ncbi:MAG: hypothetical protein IJ386_03680, partial [Clostridia bacterium]|nr:hypothetical protein [Clostridia bacterium]
KSLSRSMLRGREGNATSPLRGMVGKVSFSTFSMYFGIIYYNILSDSFSFTNIVYEHPWAQTAQYGIINSKLHYIIA